MPFPDVLQRQVGNSFPIPEIELNPHVRGTGMIDEIIRVLGN